MNKIQVYLAGRVAVEEKFNEKYSNAHLDLKKAKDIAIKMVSEYAMGENLLANEVEVAKILDEAIKEVRVLYHSNIDLINRVYEVLLKKEVIHKEDIKNIKNEIF